MHSSLPKSCDIFWPEVTFRKPLSGHILGHFPTCLIHNFFPDCFHLTWLPDLLSPSDMSVMKAGTLPVPRLDTMTGAKRCSRTIVAESDELPERHKSTCPFPEEDEEHREGKPLAHSYKTHLELSSAEFTTCSFLVAEELKSKTPASCVQQPRVPTVPKIVF